ncbi:integrase, catalytic region, zinc finger, CCHC-type containing protein [Tanacetum coccineum]
MDSITLLGLKNTLAEYMILSGLDNRPPMLDKDLYDSWKSRIELYIQNREHEIMILESVKNGLLIWPIVEENGSCQGFIGESSITDASLPPEWSKFVTDVKIVKDLHTTNFDQLNAYHEQHKIYANEVRHLRERNQDPLAFVANQQMTPPHFNTYRSSYNNPQLQQYLAVPVFSPGDDPITCLNKEMSFLTDVASSRFPSTNNQLRTSSNPRNQATIQDDRVIMQQVQGRQGQSYSGTGYKSNATSFGETKQVDRQGLLNATTVKVKDIWLGNALSLSEQGMQHDPRVPDGQAIQTIIPNNAAFLTEDLDTYYSNCDDISNVKAVLMANISNYGSDVISESSVDKQCLEIAKKELLLENDRLLQQIMSQYVLLTMMNSMSLKGESVNKKRKRNESCGKCLNLDDELLKSQNAHSDLLKSYSQLEKHCISLELSIQLNQEIFQKDESCNNQNALEILEFFENNDLKAQLHDKETTICKLKEIIKSMSEKSKEENVNYDYCEIETKNVELENRMFKLDLDPLAPRLLQNRESYIDYLKYTLEQAHILQGIVEQAKSKQPLDNALNFACKHAQRIQELLVYVRDTCPNAIKLSVKKVAVTPKNNVKKVRFAEPLTSSSNIKQVESLKTTSRNIKNKVEAQPRKVNKKNLVVEPICDDNVKHSKLIANFDLNCATCKKSWFDDVHDKCLLDFMNNVNSRAKSAKKHKKENIWRPTSHEFTKVGLKWKPTGRTFTIVGNLCPLTRITSANVVPPKKTTSHSVETQKPELKVYSRKPKNVKNVGSSKKAKIVESKNANHSEPNHTWGSNATDIPSSSSLVMTGTVRFGNDHIARIIGYGDYQLGNVTISRVYYNGVVERRNQTLVEAARTMLIFSKAPLFLWAKAINTSCYTKNRSSIRLRYNKTPYELMQDKKPNLSFFHVFGALCYPTNDNDDPGKLDAKDDIGIFIGYVPAKKAFRIYKKRTWKIIETIHVTFDELTTMASEQFIL